MQSFLLVRPGNYNDKSNYLAVSPVSMLENVTEFAKVTEREIASSVDKNISGGN